MRKGLALPIELLVIISIAVIVLIAVIAVFMGIWVPFGASQQQRANLASKCTPWANAACSDYPTDGICKAACGVYGGITYKTSATVTSCETVVTCGDLEVGGIEYEASKTNPVYKELRKACGCSAVSSPEETSGGGAGGGGGWVIS